jgi:amidase
LRTSPSGSGCSGCRRLRWPGPALAICRTALQADAEPAARHAVEDAAARLAAAGATVGDVVLPDDFTGLTAARVTINDVEIARSLTHDLRVARERPSPRLAAVVETGRAIPPRAYRATQRAAREPRAAFAALLGGADAPLMLGVAGEAPEGLGHTGDSRFQGLWTLLHGPVIGLPTSRRTRGLPVGIQPVVPNAAHGRLLAVAQWLAPALGPSTARGSGP